MHKSACRFYLMELYHLQSFICQAVSNLELIFHWFSDTVATVAFRRGSSSIGRASAFQADCCGFESRLPLQHSLWKCWKLKNPARVDTSLTDGTRSQTWDEASQTCRWHVCSRVSEASRARRGRVVLCSSKSHRVPSAAPTLALEMRARSSEDRVADF